MIESVSAEKRFQSGLLGIEFPRMQIYYYRNPLCVKFLYLFFSEPIGKQSEKTAAGKGNFFAFDVCYREREFP